MFSCSTFTVVAADAGGTENASRDSEIAAISRGRVRIDSGNHLKETAARPFQWFSHNCGDWVRYFLSLTGARQSLSRLSSVGTAFATAKRTPHKWRYSW